MRPWVKAVLLVVLLTALALLVRPVKQFLAVDACLDRGGAWDGTLQQCKGARE
jgi:hypothetical protein